MIHYISGELVHKTEDYLVVEAHGVGYQIFVPNALHHSLPGIGEDLKLFTYHHIREDQQSLFGFLNQEDLNIFNILTSINGLGPKLGMKIIAAISTSDLVKAILQGDIYTLTSISGVGKKMAERIIVELKDKLPKTLKADFTGLENTTTSDSLQLRSLEQDLTLALKTLGYSTEEIKRSIFKARSSLQPETSLEDGVKVLLKHL
jgi:holliday junction DNA helicase RuvA